MKDRQARWQRIKSRLTGKGYVLSIASNGAYVTCPHCQQTRLLMNLPADERVPKNFGECFDCEAVTSAR